MTLRDIDRLDECYQLERKTLFITGLQALVRLLLLQSYQDRGAGLNTAGFVSGYRGSPLGGLDRPSRHIPECRLNKELSTATAPELRTPSGSCGLTTDCSERTARCDQRAVVIRHAV